MKPHDRYVKVVEWSDEDNCYVGSVPEWLGQCCHGDTRDQVYAELCCIVDEWIELYKQDGRPLPPSTSSAVQTINACEKAEYQISYA